MHSIEGTRIWHHALQTIMDEEAPISVRLERVLKELKRPSNRVFRYRTKLLQDRLRVLRQMLPEFEILETKPANKSGAFFITIKNNGIHTAASIELRVVPLDKDSRYIWNHEGELAAYFTEPLHLSPGHVAMIELRLTGYRNIQDIEIGIETVHFNTGESWQPWWKYKSRQLTADGSVANRPFRFASV